MPTCSGHWAACLARRSCSFCAAARFWESCGSGDIANRWPMLDQPFKTAPAVVPEMSELTTLPGGSIWKLALRREALVAIAFVAVQIAILVLMIVLDGLPLLLGQRLMLKVVPV